MNETAENIIGDNYSEYKLIYINLDSVKTYLDPRIEQLDSTSFK